MEKSREVDRILRACRAAAGLDLEAVETAVRAAALAAGAKVLEGLLAPVGAGHREEALRCPCGRKMASRGIQRKVLLTLLGDVPFSRSAFQCPGCGRVRYPGDEELDVVRTGYSPGVRRLVADFASDATFKRASHQRSRQHHLCREH